MLQILQRCAVGSVGISEWLANAMEAYRKSLSPTPWVEKFAWKPVLIHGKRVWLKKYYARTIVIETDRGGNLERVNEYGTLFDLLKGSE